jgi:hypothetical protein
MHLPHKKIYSFNRKISNYTKLYQTILHLPINSISRVYNIKCKHCCQMEQSALQNVNNCLNANIYSYLETSGGQSSNLYLNVVNFFYANVNWTSVET